MFSNFVIFNEVVKLSKVITYRLERVNFSKHVLDIIFRDTTASTVKQIHSLIEDRKTMQTFYKILAYHCRCYGDAELVDYASKLDCNLRSFKISLFIGACRYGRLDIIKSCYNDIFCKKNERWKLLKKEKGFEEAVKNNHLDIVTYLVEENNLIFSVRLTLFLAKKYQKLEIINYFGAFNNNQPQEISIENIKLSEDKKLFSEILLKFIILGMIILHLLYKYHNK